MNHYSSEEVLKIVSLREGGMSYSEIATTLGRTIPKSSLSYICRNVVMSDEYRINFSKSRNERLESARILALNKNGIKFINRIDRIKKSAAEMLSSDKREYCIVLGMLYWAEGGKWPSRSGLFFGSSDPDMLNTYLLLLEKCYNIPRSIIKARIQLRADQDESFHVNYWSEILHLGKGQFYPCYVDKRSKGKVSKKKDYHGVCSLTCAGTDIQIELQEIAGIISRSWGISSAG